MNKIINKKINIKKNLVYLRKVSHMTIEEVADKIGVSRQAVAKWENGESIPDVINCDALAGLYDVTIDDLLHFDGENQEVGMAPKGKHLFGTAVLGERGQVVIPKQARDLLKWEAGERLVVLGDTRPASQGIALLPADSFMQAAKEIMDNFYPERGGE
ncbi:helix-turn-helix domain-containing protein [Enterococcus sp. LJL51]|uniref:helix-turn-helix domain-containing protein n=1 Tax=Enterococcus sp. LJL51 TaxID=3416656 RepID=UPI003CF4173F